MYYKSPLTYLIPFLFILFLFGNVNVNSEQQFVQLAESFLKGSLSFVKVAKISDTVFFANHYFWPLGPFPAVILLPFVVVFKSFLQGYIEFPLNILNFYLVYKIARKFKVEHQKSLFLAVFFIFGSIYAPLGAIPGSWYFSQVVACSLILLAIYEFLGTRRFLLIGICIALAVATRMTTIFSSVFFLYYLVKKPIDFTRIIKFTLPIAIIVLILGIYNQARFSNPLESGYNLQLIPKDAQIRRAAGLFSPKHIPGNLFYMLLKGPEPILSNDSHILVPPYISFDSYGLSIFFLSPILFLIFVANYKKELVKVSAFTVLIISIPVITYYGIGQKQVGYRYALDFLPFLTLIVIDTAKKINNKILYPTILFGVFFSMYFTYLYLGGKDL